MKRFVMAIFLMLLLVFILWTLPNLPEDFTHTQKQILYMIPVFIIAIVFYLMVSV